QHSRSTSHFSDHHPLPPSRSAPTSPPGGRAAAPPPPPVLKKSAGPPPPPRTLSALPARERREDESASEGGRTQSSYHGSLEPIMSPTSSGGDGRGERSLKNVFNSVVTSFSGTLPLPLPLIPALGEGMLIWGMGWWEEGLELLSSDRK